MRAHPRQKLPLESSPSLTGSITHCMRSTVQASGKAWVWVGAKIEIRLGGNRLRSMAHAGSASGYCQAGKPFMCIEANLSFISIREHTRLAERWAGKACRRGSLRWLLLRASVSCDAQQLIAISHRAPDWTSASLLRPSRLPVATPAASQPPPRASWGQRSEHAAARAAGNAVSNFLEHASRNVTT